MSSLSIAGLTKSFGGVTAVGNLDLDVAEGEFVSLLGPSGCGKTTTLRCVAGLEAPSRGTIRFGTRDVTALPPERRSIGMVFQNYALFPHMTVAQNVGFGLATRGIGRSDATARIRAVLAMVQLAGLEERYPRQLSGGQQQRVALARALVIEPALLLLDEPLANLDAKLREEMRFLIRALQQRVGITTLYVTHDQAESMTMSDRIVVMFDGAIHQVGAPEDIYDRPATAEVASFIGWSNFVPVRVVESADGAATVDAGFGRLRCRAAHPRAPGSTATAMIRPEAIRIANGEDSTYEGRIVGRSFLGNLVDYRVALGAETVVRMQALGGPAHSNGTAVRIAVDPDKAWLLP